MFSLLDSSKSFGDGQQRPRDGRIFLKVKLKELEAEGKFIRREEQKARERKDRDLRVALAAHRRGNRREEAYATVLAYRFIRGKALLDKPPYHIVTRAIRMVNAFANPPSLNDHITRKQLVAYDHIIDREARAYFGLGSACQCKQCETEGIATPKAIVTSA